MNGYSDWDGYCEHGQRVGGCGIDWICGLCEDGISYEEWAAYLVEARTKRIRQVADAVQGLSTELLKMGKSGAEVWASIATFFSGS